MKRKSVKKAAKQRLDSGFASEVAGNSKPDQLLQFEMNVGGRPVKAEIPLPNVDSPMRLLLPAFRKFTDLVIGAEVANVLEGTDRTISCGPACGACCRQLVPISAIEARELKRMLGKLRGPRKAAIRNKMRVIRETLEQENLLESLTVALQNPTDQRALFKVGVDYMKLGLPCPFLENESCGIHEVRPLICREYLVTSSFEHCAWPTADKVQGINLPRKFSELLARFQDGKGESQVAKVPLALVGDWPINEQVNEQLANDVGTPELFNPMETFKSFMNGMAVKMPKKFDDSVEKGESFELMS